MKQTNYVETEKSLRVSGGQDIKPNVVSALKRNLKEPSPALVSHDGHFVVVGSGPSLPDFIDEIRKERLLGRPICSVKGSHDFLCENGVEPDLFLSVEPQDRREHLKLKNDHTVYLIASRCDPVMFDHLSDKKLMVFHSWSNNENWPELKGRLLIGGGTTSGLRAVTFGYVQGFRNFILYGMDSCLSQDGKTKRFTGEKAGMVVDRIVGNRTFYCNGAMALQADEFQEYYKVMPDVHFDIKGDGLLAQIVNERKKRGYSY